MRYLCFILIILSAVSARSAGAATLAEARQRRLRGNNEEARVLYLELIKEPEQKDAATIGLSQLLQSDGKDEEALALVDKALEESPRSADLLDRRAELLYRRGRWADADKTADGVLKLRQDDVRARWVRGQVYRDRADVDRADREFAAIVRTYSERSDQGNDIKDPDELLVVGLAGCEHARLKNLPDQFEFVLNEVYGDALKLDKDFWPAEYQAGMLLLEKYNRAEALPAFAKALAINPRAAEALVGMGMAALQKYEFRDAEQFAERALKINPFLPEALDLRADVFLATGDAGKALEQLEQARRINPRDENTLGRVAACHYLQHRPDDLQKLVEQVEAFDPRPGLFYYRLATQLEERRWFGDAEKYCRKAMEMRPLLPGPRNSLGLLCMRLGREDEARALLSQAFEADPFNVRVSNSLKVLEHLQGYQTIKTKHFVLRFDARHDQRQAQYMSRYLEEIYSDLSKKFQYEPSEPFLVELFTSHEMFSGRTIALPDLHTIGACTGRTMAMVSPHGKGIGQPFNWARVLRHELVHLFNLDQTHYQVPHWLTEGLAVINEGLPRPPSWNQMLLQRVPTESLLNLDDIELGFIRPRGPDEWQLAYCQSRLYVEYLTQTFGPQTVGELLNAYRDGLDTNAAITRVCKVDKPAFEKGYRAYLEGIVKTIKGKPVERPLTLAQLKKARDNDPDNAELSGRLALQYLEHGQRAEARKLSEKVLAAVKAQPEASYVKAELLHAAGDEEGARAVLEAALNPQAPAPILLGLLGKIYFGSKQFADAARIDELGHKAEPYESRWLAELARVYARTGNTDRLIDILEDLAPTDADDLLTRKRLAELLATAARYVEAERYARQALEIDVLDAKVYQFLGDALAGQKKAAEAIEAYQTALEIDADATGARLKLAQSYLENGNKAQAQQELQQVLARDPKNELAQRLRHILEN